MLFSGAAGLWCQARPDQLSSDPPGHRLDSMLNLDYIQNLPQHYPLNALIEHNRLAAFLSCKVTASSSFLPCSGSPLIAAMPTFSCLPRVRSRQSSVPPGAHHVQSGKVTADDNDRSYTAETVEGRDAPRPGQREAGLSGS